MFLSHYYFHHGNIENIGNEDLNAVVDVLRAFLVSECHPTLNVVGTNLWAEHFNDDGLICFIVTRRASCWDAKVVNGGLQRSLDLRMRLVPRGILLHCDTRPLELSGCQRVHRKVFLSD